MSVSDVEFLALCGHPFYKRHPEPKGLDNRLQVVPSQLAGSLTRKDKNIVVMSQSKARARAERFAKIRAQTVALFEAQRANPDNGEGQAEAQHPRFTWECTEGSGP